jgi:beta-lactamase regulating signal transducer with metallopeptidase domain
MQVLIAIALKSLLIAGASLALLALMKHRSAGERSWVAHIGLVALIALAFAPLILPVWTIEAPSLLGELSRPGSATAALAPTDTTGPAAAVSPAPSPSGVTVSAAAAATAAYALPAAILLFVTVLALARLIALRARADVLVDAHWLSALARAQRRMGFKHGTALLTSDELSSPISWGLMRPVILLNTRAVEASSEAEAIIAHELAHVARMDWVKLLLARIATALFWFNPLVWILAREAHQLREETADDAVLAADIAGPDYAQLLVGVARHECPGLLLGAHGVAPSKSSLARRVARVLDGQSVRGPVARSFAAGVLVGAVIIAAPLAALTLAPGGSAAATAQANRAGNGGIAPYYAPSEAPSDLAHLIADGVTTSVATAMSAVDGPLSRDDRSAVIERAFAQAAEARELALAQAGDAQERARAGAHAQKSAIDKIIEMKAVGVTPAYANAMRALSPRMRNVDADDLVGMRAVGVTPEYARGLATAGLGNLDADQLTEARAVGVDGSYVQALRAVGVTGDIDDFVQLRALGVSPEYVRGLRSRGYAVSDPDDVAELWAVGGHLGHGISPPSLPPPPPKPPRVIPDDWNPLADPDDDGG